jgi:hypothetical protein
MVNDYQNYQEKVHGVGEGSGEIRFFKQTYWRDRGYKYPADWLELVEGND